MKISLCIKSLLILLAVLLVTGAFSAILILTKPGSKAQSPQFMGNTATSLPKADDETSLSFPDQYPNGNIFPICDMTFYYNNGDFEDAKQVNCRQGGTSAYKVIR